MTGELIIVSGVSGSGKTSIVGAAIASGVGVRIITCTTRAPRMNNGILEVEGVDYFFMNENEFTKLVRANEFAEYENNYGKFYGTRKKDIAAALAAHDIAFSIVDTRGAVSLMNFYPDARSIFILAEKKEIQKRLQLRGENKDAIVRRMQEFDVENEQSSFFDFIVLNLNDRLNIAIAIFLLFISLRI